MARRKVVLATHMGFWRLSAGALVRVASLVRYLGAHPEIELTVAYVGLVGAVDRQQLAAMGPGWEFVALAPDRKLAVREYTRLFAALCAERRFDACIIDRIELTFLLDGLPPGTRKLLDTHDIQSDAAENMRRFGTAPIYVLTADQEFGIFRSYDAVIAIQELDHARIRAELGEAHAILAPYPAIFAKQAPRPQARSLGFVASGWKANVDGIGWFAAEVWPLLRREGLTLDLYGFIGEIWKPPEGHFIRAHGFQPDLAAVYGAIDIVINPVRYGSGLKIKTVEALGHGMPLVTSREGARGLDEAAGRAFLVADDAEAFAAHLNRLIDDRDARAALGAAAYEFAQAKLSPDACYGALARALLA